MTEFEAVLDLLKGPDQMAQAILNSLTFEPPDQFSLAIAEGITKRYIPGEYKFVKWYFPKDRAVAYEVIASFPSQEKYIEIKLTWF